MDTQVATKTEFARLCNVSQGRVSQWISEGKLGAGELIGQGRNAKINVEKAREKLKLRLDPAQKLGNGLETKLGPGGPADGLDLKLKQAKLEQAEAQNRKLREEEQARVGIYVRAEHVSAEAGKLASTILQMTEGGLADMASLIAAEWKLPQRDVMHIMRTQFRELRAKLSAKLAAEAMALPETTEDTETDS